MGRNRVLSFVSHLSTGVSREPTPSPSPPAHASPDISKGTIKPEVKYVANQHNFARRPVTPPSDSDYGSPVSRSPPSTSPPESPSSLDDPSTTTYYRKRSGSRPLSIVGGYQAPLMEVNEDTVPELLPIFALLNTHQNKLYQEGYFLKLDDQNTQGKANADRTWTECFAQLVGTVLSLWDAAELDAAGEDGEVLPKFINLTDASLKMIDSLPTRSNDEQPLQNILSLSTAGKNRYLLHFNSHHALVQWTAGIRLAMFEHSTLQEAYTGALIAGKAKSVNNINVIMERSKFKVEDWVRVRFGAGVPWRRCWCVITPPDEKEVAKMQKEMKKKSPYDRSHAPVLKGDIKFYDHKVEGKKQKKSLPIASIHDAYSAFSIYPQAKSLIDASTLIKIEGNISIHTDPPSVSEGFVFVMPETRPMVSGIETMLRFLFPTWDTFGLYGRPGKLVASTLDSRSLMFAMPKSRKYGYLELLDVSGLIVDSTRATWDEREWRRRLKEATGKRMNDVEDGVKTHARSGSNQSNKMRVGFAADGPATRSSRSFSLSGRNSPNRSHTRNASETSIMGGLQGSPQRKPVNNVYLQDRFGSNSPASSDDENRLPPPQEIGGMRSQMTPDPVSRPGPTQNRGAAARPNSAYHSPELRRANSRLSTTTLAQLANAGGLSHLRDDGGDSHHQQQPQQQQQALELEAQGAPVIQTNLMGNPMDTSSREGFHQPPNQRPGFHAPPPLNLSVNARSASPNPNSPYGPPSPYSSTSNSLPGTADGRRSPYPPRGPNTQQSQSPLPHQGRGGPPGVPPHGGRGRAPNGPAGDSFNRGHGSPGPGRGGPPGGAGGRGYAPSSQGRGGYAPQQQQQQQQQARRPMPPQAPQGMQPPGSPYRDSVTPNIIIDHYATDKPQGQGPPATLPYHSAPQDPAYHDASRDRPRMGTMKTVGGADAMEAPPGSQYGIPDINFGSSAQASYGAPPPRRPQNGLNPPGSLGMMQRPGSSQARDAEGPPANRNMADYGMQQAAGQGDARMRQGGPPGNPASFSRPLPPQHGDPRMMAQGQYGSRSGTPSGGRNQPPYQGQAM